MAWIDVINEELKRRGLTDPSELSLKELLELTRGYVMTDEEREEQRINFAWGNLALHRPGVTREDIVRAAEDVPLPRRLHLVEE